MKALLQLRSVCARWRGGRDVHGYNSRRAVSLTVSRGKWLAIVGENGIGKSTLLCAIAGVANCVTGEIIFNDEPLLPRDVAARHKKGIQLVPQHASLSDIGLSLQDARNLATLKRPALDNDITICDFFAKIKKLGWPSDNLNSRLFDLVAAILSVPRILLLDEIIPVLQWRTVRLYQHLRHLLPMATVIFTDHDLSRVLEVSDSILWLRNNENPTIVDCSDAVAVGNLKAAMGNAPVLKPNEKCSICPGILSLSLSPCEQINMALIASGLSRQRRAFEKARLTSTFPFLIRSTPTEELSGGERIVTEAVILKLTGLGTLSRELIEHLATSVRNKLISLEYIDGLANDSNLRTPASTGTDS